MNKYLMRFLVFTLVISCFTTIAYADGIEHITGSTVGIPDEIHSALNNYLDTNPPAATQWYEVTSLRQSGSGWWVSLVGVETQTNLLQLEDSNNAIWAGAVKVYPNGAVLPFSLAVQLP